MWLRLCIGPNAFGNALGSSLVEQARAARTEALLIQAGKDIMTSERFAEVSPTRNPLGSWNGDGESMPDAGQVVIYGKRLNWFQKGLSMVAEAGSAVGDFVGDILGGSGSTPSSSVSPGSVGSFDFANAVAANRARLRKHAYDAQHPQSYAYAVTPEMRNPYRANSFEQQVARTNMLPVHLAMQSAADLGGGAGKIRDGQYVAGILQAGSGALMFAPGLPIGRVANLFKTEPAILGQELNTAIRNADLSTRVNIGGQSPIGAHSIEAVWLDSAGIRQSQKSISYAKSVGYNLDDISRGFIENPADPRLSIDAVRMKDGLLTSMDNSRPAVLNATGGGKIQVRVRAFDDPLLASEMDRFTALRGGEARVPSTWGEAVDARIWKQGDQFMSLYPNGSPFIPKISGAPDNSIWSQYNQFPWKR